MRSVTLLWKFCHFNQMFSNVHHGAGLQLLAILFLLFPVNVNKICNRPQWENICVAFSICTGLIPFQTHKECCHIWPPLNGHQSQLLTVYQWPEIQMIKISAFFLLQSLPVTRKYFKQRQSQFPSFQNLINLRIFSNVRVHHHSSSSFTSITR